MDGLWVVESVADTYLNFFWLCMSSVITAFVSFRSANAC